MVIWDPTYFIFALPALILALIAQGWVKSAYRRYLRVPNSRGISGAEAAVELLRYAGLSVRLEGIQRELGDHYDPRGKVLRLSPGVARTASVASVAIVAHEVGHAIQDARAFMLLRLRSGLVAVVNFTSWLGPILFMIGWMLNMTSLAWLGVLFFSGAVVFALVTLPVEIDASRRALHLLRETGILQTDEELRGARQVLTAAALTYVAALAQAISTLLYYVFLLSGGRRRRI